MTELERARALLSQAQAGLAYYRRCAGEGIRVGDCIRDNELCVLAALSWVWEEQTKDHLMYCGRHRRDCSRMP